jgi:pre-mRNA-splicing helicase BRR2
MSGRPAGKPDYSGYSYGAISSLVLTADRSALPRRDREPDGAPTSLVGRINPGEMGSRVQRQAPKDVYKKKKKATASDEATERQVSKRRNETTGFGFADILDVTANEEGLTYRPRTAETREVYELILSSVHQLLGDQAHDVVRSAADIILETLKSEGMKDFDKKREAEKVLGPISNENFSQLVSLSKKITDYGAEDEAVVDPDMERKDAEIDEEMGVAVVFDEEEEESEDEEGYEVKEDSDEEDEEPRDEGETNVEEVDEDVHIGGEATDPRSAVEKDVVAPRSIDGFWVQRQVAELYPDPVTAADKASSVLSILGSESNLRDCENQLMELFDFQSHNVITKFLKNRDVVVWCTKLVRADENERVNIEVAMRERGVGWILRDLSGDKSTGKPTTGRADENAMEVDAHPAQVLKKATLLPGSVVQPKKIVDLESMTFSQAGHLMSNKRVQLPEGSFKRSRKGYEEVHVPAPKKQPNPDSLIPITALPEWAQSGFPKMQELNRVQSKLFPVAFGTDEPILLCAPTGAGKVCLYLSFYE